MNTKPITPAEPKKKGPDDVPTDANNLCNNLESYLDIKNRAPTVIKTWQELMEGERDDENTPE